jgi:(2R)-ethylmalonyl-CoA mutase
MDISYEGIRLTPEEIVAAAQAEEAHVIGLDPVGQPCAAGRGGHDSACARRVSGHVPVMVGGIIPDEDAKNLKSFGVARVYTPKDFELNRIMMDIVHWPTPRPMAAE